MTTEKHILRPRNRVHYILYVIASIALGLFSRSGLLPQVIYPYAGDVLYAVMFFFIIGTIAINKTSLQVAVVAVLICYGVELSQLIQTDWMIALRQYKIVALILGYQFLWSDLVCYTVGGTIGFLSEKIVLRRS